MKESVVAVELAILRVLLKTLVMVVKLALVVDKPVSELLPEVIEVVELA